MANRYQGLALLIPDKSDVERDAIAAAWESRGGRVLRLGRFWEPPDIDPVSVRIYGNDTFGLVLAEKLNLKLVSPDDDLLIRVDQGLLKRTVAIRSLSEALAGAFPTFIKPVIPKTFTAAVYAAPEELAKETDGLEATAEVYVSEVVTIEAEVRCFVLDGKVVTASCYEGSEDTTEAVRLAEQIASTAPVPDTCGLDFGLIPERGWGFIEANASWGAGLNGCDAEKAVACIARACRAAE